MSGTVYAESEEEAEELICDINNIHDQVFDDSDGDLTDYSYDNVEIELEEEDTDELPISRSTETPDTTIKLPSYYLSDINLI